MKNNTITLGKKVKLARLEKKLTQQDVVGSFITRNMLSKIENDIATPSIKTIDYLAQKLDKPISYFLQDSDLIISKEENKGLGLVFEHSCFLIKNMEFEKCVQYIEAALQQQNYSNTTYYHGPVLYNLIVCYMHLKNYVKVNTIYLDAANFLELSGDCYYLSKLCMELNTLCLNTKKSKYCEGLVKKAVYYFEKSFTNDIAFKIDIYYELGCLLILKKEFSKAVEYLNIALDTCKQNNLYYNSSNIHLKLFIVYKNMLDLETSLYHIKKAIILLEYSSTKMEQASALKQLSLLYISMEDFNSAIIYLFKCLKYYDKNSLSANNLKCAILLCLLNKGFYKKVIVFSEQIDLKHVDTFWKSISSYSLALSNLKLGNLKTVEHDLIKAISFIENITPHHYKQLYLKSLSAAYTAISEFYSAQNNYEKAYTFLSKSNQLLKNN